MNTNDKGGSLRPEQNQDKDNHISTTFRVLEIFLSGQKITAYALNMRVGFNDARKSVSLLREAGYPIQDYRLPDRRKIYWLPDNWQEIMEAAKRADKQQLTLFGYDNN